MPMSREMLVELRNSHSMEYCASAKKSHGRSLLNGKSKLLNNQNSHRDCAFRNPQKTVIYVSADAA